MTEILRFFSPTRFSANFAFSSLSALTSSERNVLQINGRRLENTLLFGKIDEHRPINHRCKTFFDVFSLVTFLRFSTFFTVLTFFKNKKSYIKRKNLHKLQQEHFKTIDINMPTSAYVLLKFMDIIPFLNRTT